MGDGIERSIHEPTDAYEQRHTHGDGVHRTHCDYERVRQDDDCRSARSLKRERASERERESDSEREREETWIRPRAGESTARFQLELTPTVGVATANAIREDKGSAFAGSLILQVFALSASCVSTASCMISTCECCVVSPGLASVAVAQPCQPEREATLYVQHASVVNVRETNTAQS